MKKLPVLSALALTAASFGAFAAMSPNVENTLIAVCKAGISNSPVQFAHTMKDYRINEARIFPRLVCNGDTFYDFTVAHGADKTAKRIARYLPGQVTIKDLAMVNQDEMLYVNFDE